MAARAERAHGGALKEKGAARGGSRGRKGTWGKMRLGECSRGISQVRAQVSAREQARPCAERCRLCRQQACQLSRTCGSRSCMAVPAAGRNDGGMGTAGVGGVLLGVQGGRNRGGVRMRGAAEWRVVGRERQRMLGDYDGHHGAGQGPRLAVRDERPNGAAARRGAYNVAGGCCLRPVRRGCALTPSSPLPRPPRRCCWTGSHLRGKSSHGDGASAFERAGERCSRPAAGRGGRWRGLFIVETDSLTPPLTRIAAFAHALCPPAMLLRLLQRRHIFRPRKPRHIVLHLRQRQRQAGKETRGSSFESGAREAAPHGATPAPGAR